MTSTHKDHTFTPVQVNVYDLKWKYLRCYWISRSAIKNKPSGYIFKIGYTYHKYLFV